MNTPKPARPVHALLLALLCLSLTARAQTGALIKARPDFQNQLYLAAPTNAPGTALMQPASVALASGSLGDATNLTNHAPGDGLVFLAQSLVGQPFTAPPVSLAPPVILSSPTNNIFTYVGSNAVLTVSVSSDSPVSYQWFHDGVALTGATNASLALVNIQPLNAGYYTVAITNSFSVVTSAVSVLSVDVPVTINFDALDATTNAVQSEVLQNYLALHGVTMSNVTAGTQLQVNDDRRTYGGLVIVSPSGHNTISQGGSNGVIQFTLNFSVPQNSVSFTRAGFGPALSSFTAWSAHAFDAAFNEVSTTNEGVVVGSNLPPRAFTLSGANITSVRWDANNCCQGFSSIVMDDLVLPQGAPVIAPGIIMSPQSQVVAAGSNVLLRVAAVALPLPGYQWFHNGAALNGATNATLALANVQLANSGNYTVVVSNALGAATSLVATLTIPTLQIARQGSGTVSTNPVQLTYAPGQSVTLTATPARYYTFLRWSDGVTNSNRTITIGANNSLTAIFTNTVALESKILPQWEQTYGGSGSDFATVVKQTSDGGYAVGGYSDSSINGTHGSTNCGGFDWWFIKLDSSGRKVLDKSFGSPNGNDILRDFVETSDGFVLCGSAYFGTSPTKTVSGFGETDYQIIKIDGSGQLIWERAFGGAQTDDGASLIQTADGGFLLGGLSYSAGGTGNRATNKVGGGYDAWLVRTDSAGNKLWETVTRNPNSSVTKISSLPDGSFLTAGFSDLNSQGDFDFWSARLNASGQAQWETIYGGANGETMVGPGAVATLEGNLVMVGRSSSGNSGDKNSPSFGLTDIWAIKADADGNLVSQTSFGAANSDAAYAVELDHDGGFLLVGSYESTGGNRTSPGYGSYDAVVIKVDANLVRQHEISFGGSSVDYFSDIRATADGGFVAVGASSSLPGGTRQTPNYGGYDFWIVKFIELEVPPGTPTIFINGFLGNDATNVFNTQSPVSITLTSTWNGPIHYTLDGSEPDFTSAQYDPQNPPQLAPPATVKAIAYLDDNYFASGLYVDYSEVVSTRLDHIPLYTLNLSTPGGGMIAANPADPVFLSNTVATISATNLPGWTFLGWQGGLTGTNPVESVTLRSNFTAQAIFGTALTTNATTGGSIARLPVLPLYSYGSPVRLTALPAASRYLAFWTGALSGAISPQELIITNANPVVGASFGNLGPVTNFSLTVQITGEGTVSYTPATNRFGSNAVVMLTAAPKPGWAFTNWSGASNSLLNLLALVMNTNKTVTANFVPGVSPSITAQPQSLTVNRDSNAAFTVTATGVPAPAYQWFRNGAGLPGATGTTLNIPNAQGLDGGTYFVVVSNSLSSVTSSVVTLKVIVYPPGLVAWWRGEDDAMDFIGGNNGSLVGGATFGSGRVGRAFNFNGQAQSVVVPTSPVLNVTTDFSFEAWINPSAIQNSPTGGGSIVSKGSGVNGYQYEFDLLNGNAAMAASFIAQGEPWPNNRIATNLVSPVPLGAWTHVAWTYDHNTSRVYVNGAQVGSLLVGPKTVNGTVSNFRISGDDNGNVMFNGLIDEVAVYSRALSGAEIQAHFNAGATGYFTSPAVVTSPSNQTAAAGANLVLNSSASGALPLVYQWYFNGTNLAGATAATLSIPSFQTANTGMYFVVVTNFYGSATSSVAVLSLPAVPNTPPDVALTNPANGAVFIAPASVVLAATASDSNGAVASVSFHADGALLGAVTVAPFQFTWTNAPLGQHTLAAVATDNGGLSATSAVVFITITNLPPVVQLVQPTNGAVFVGPTHVALAASAADTGGAVTLVRYFQDGTNLIGQSAGGPGYNTVWSNAPVGTFALTAQATDNDGATTVSAPHSITLNPPAAGQPVFRLAALEYGVREANTNLVVTVLKQGGAGTVNFTVAGGSATEGQDFGRVSGSLSFSTTQMVATLSIPIYDDFLPEELESFLISLSAPSTNTLIATPGSATITITNDDTGLSFLSHTPPGPPPAALASLTASLSPTNAAGQWRLPDAADPFWRDGGVVAEFLEPGNYDIELLPRAGWHAEPTAFFERIVSNPPLLTVVTSVYLPGEISAPGWLTVTLEPPEYASLTRWRRQGEAAWHPGGDTIQGLPPGEYVIEFLDLATNGLETPFPRVVTVSAGFGAEVAAHYKLAAPGAGLDLVEKTLATVRNNSLNFGYGFNGQLRTALGYGSGTAVRDRVVLTAAHVLFNETNFAFASEVWWYFQRHKGEFEPRPLQPSGLIVFSNYVAARATNAPPEVLEPLDVAALYFTDPAPKPARGGSSGYLASDAANNEWLSFADRAKFIAGYPMTAPVAADHRGRLFTSPNDSTAAFQPRAPGVFRTFGFTGLPGMSGGGLYVFESGTARHYPAAVYLGGNSDSSIVRAIDSSVVNLLDAASRAALGDTNHYAAGLVAVSLINGTAGQRKVRVDIGPPSALALDGGWRSPTMNVTLFSTNTSPVVTTATNVLIEFKPVPGFLTPPPTNAPTVPGQTTRVQAAYVAEAPRLFFSSAGLRVSGPSGTVFVLEFKNTFTDANWSTLSTHTLTGGSATLPQIRPTNTVQSRFYQLRWLTNF